MPETIESPSTALITPGLVELDVPALDAADATRRLSRLLGAEGRISDVDGFFEDVQTRERQMATGMPGGVGLPHARSEYALIPSLAFARLSSGVDFGDPGGPATLIFLVAAPADDGTLLLEILAALARRLVVDDFRRELGSVAGADDAATMLARDIRIG